MKTTHALLVHQTEKITVLYLKLIYNRDINSSCKLINYYYH